METGETKNSNLGKKKLVAFYRLSKVENSLLQKFPQEQRNKVKREIFEGRIQTQKNMVNEAALKLNAEIIYEYSDIIKRNMVRGSNEFTIALKTALSNNADLILSTFDRIGDEIYFAFETKAKLEAKGLKLLFADYLDADELILAVKLAISKKERELICKRQREKAKWIKKFGITSTGNPPGNPDFKTGKNKSYYSKAKSEGRKKSENIKFLDHDKLSLAAYIIESKKSGKNFNDIADNLNLLGKLPDKYDKYDYNIVYRIYNKYIMYYDGMFGQRQTA